MKNRIKQHLINALSTTPLYPRASSIKDIEFAFDIANVAHAGVLRDGGTPYITHPVEGCVMMARDYGILNSNLYIAFLLHDTGEDTTIFGDITELAWQEFTLLLVERISKMFNPTVGQIVRLLTKPYINGDDFSDKQQVMTQYITDLETTGSVSEFATFAKMIDRLHNLRSLLPTNLNKIQRQVIETEGVLLPLFERVLVRIDGEAKTVECTASPEIFEPDFYRKFQLLLSDIKKEVKQLRYTYSL